MAYTTVNKSTAHMNSKIYTGTGSSNALTGIGFQPDLVWLKGRSNATWHWWTDAVRGSSKNIFSNSNQAEGTNSDGITSFNSDGFTLGTNTDVNGSGNTFVSWNFKGNGAGSSNSDGDITATVSANTSAGFSIVKWTGTGSVATIGHGLNVPPKLIIIKRLAGNTEAWPVNVTVANSNAGGTLYLNETGSLQSYANASPYPSDTITNSIFYVGSGNNANASGSPFIAYCFANIPGYQRCGEYSGNNNVDGPFVYTGFRPQFLMFKKHNAAGNNWEVHDNARDTYNPSSKRLFANTNGTEATENYVDFLSNGFKIRTTDATGNSSHKFMYLAIGQSLVGTNGVTAKAR
jgi:hypothetical protein